MSEGNAFRGWCVFTQAMSERAGDVSHACLSSLLPLRTFTFWSWQALHLGEKRVWLQLSQPAMRRG